MGLHCCAFAPIRPTAHDYLSMNELISPRTTHTHTTGLIKRPNSVVSNELSERANSTNINHIPSLWRYQTNIPFPMGQSIHTAFMIEFEEDTHERKRQSHTRPRHRRGRMYFIPSASGMCLFRTQSHSHLSTLTKKIEKLRLCSVLQYLWLYNHVTTHNNNVRKYFFQ